MNNTLQSECRVYERHNCQLPTSCQPAASNEMRWDAIIEDLSQSGVRLRLRRRLEPRSGLAIELPGKDGQDRYTVYVKVIRVRTQEDGSYVLGCKLMSELGEDELERIVGSTRSERTDAASPLNDVPDALPAATEEEIAEPERTVIPEVRLCIGIPRGRVVYCRVKRFHVAGTWPLPPGKALNLRGVAANGSRLEHAFEVVECNQEGERWALQLRSLDPATAPDWLDSYGRGKSL